MPWLFHIKFMRRINVISLRKFVLNVELILWGIRFTSLILSEYYDDVKGNSGAGGGSYRQVNRARQSMKNK